MKLSESSNRLLIRGMALQDILIFIKRLLQEPLSEPNARLIDKFRHRLRDKKRDRKQDQLRHDEIQFKSDWSPGREGEDVDPVRHELDMTLADAASSCIHAIPDTP